MSDQADLRPREAGFVDERLRDGGERRIDIDIALDEHVDRVSGAQLRRLAIELQLCALELFVAIEQRFVSGAQLLRSVAPHERLREESEDPPEEGGALRDGNSIPATVRQSGERHLGSGIAEQARHLDDVALRDQEEVPAHFESVRQREIELDVERSQLAVCWRDAAEHLVADALARLREPSVEVHRRKRESRDHHREAKSGSAQVSPSELDVLVVREVGTQVPHDCGELGPIESLFTRLQARERDARVRDDGLEVDALLFEWIPKDVEDLAGDLAHYRPQRRIAAP